MTVPAPWSELAFFRQEYPELSARLAADPRRILPPEHQRFAALEACPPARVKLVILGQDPYPTPGHAHGLAFSVDPDVHPLPRSLLNIFKELKSDVNVDLPHGDLRHWAQQGVLLLNTVLSVPAGEANGHANLGWQRLAQEVLGEVSHAPTAFLLWGRQAQAMKRHIHPGNHLIIETAHPSPLSARRGFFGSRPFSRINAWLIERGDTPIHWGPETS